MNDGEKEYLQRVEKVIESFGVIQREFVLHKNGITAVIELIKNFSVDKNARIPLDDPIIQQGKIVVDKVIKELKNTYSQLERAFPPGEWRRFHNTLINSLVLQVKGYEIMFKTFNDYKISHILEGKELVDRGITLLAGGEKSKD